MIASYPGFPTQVTHERYPLCVCFDYTTLIHRLAVIQVTFQEGGCRQSLGEVVSPSKQYARARKY